MRGRTYIAATTDLFIEHFWDGGKTAAPFDWLLSSNNNRLPELRAVPLSVGDDIRGK